MNTPYKLVLSDLDGTLIDTLEKHLPASGHTVTLI